MEPLGNRLVRHLAQAVSSVVLVAPFIKEEPLVRLLDVLRPSVELRCYTRWRPEEVAAGVSDLDIWPLLRDRNGALHLRYDLHAKVFCADRKCLVGSANLTLAALGWKPASNLEVLVDIAADQQVLVDFFKELDQKTVRVTDAIYTEMRDLASMVRRASPYAVVTEQEEDEGSLGNWVPRCRVPGNHNLYRTYKKQWNTVAAATYEDATRDIMALGIPEGVASEAAFLRCVAVLLRQAPAVALIAERSKEAIGSAEGQELITRELGYGNGPNGEISGEEWTTLRTWITTFLSCEFRERQGDNGPELVKGRRIA
jgi:hypothetical protein